MYYLGKMNKDVSTHSTLVYSTLPILENIQTNSNADFSILNNSLNNLQKSLNKN